MSTKLMTILLALFVTGIVGFNHTERKQTQKLDANYRVSITSSATSPTRKMVDSAMTIRNQFVKQKEVLKNKIQVLKRKQRKIEGTQMQLDTIMMNMAIQATGY
jgi:hypothetical protein